MENLELQKKLDKLLNAYSHRYDIERDVTVEGGHFPATATFYLRDENYLISKKHVLSAVENYDYTYFYITDHLDAATLRHQIDLTMKVGSARVKPHREHMSSFVTLVVLRTPSMRKRKNSSARPASKNTFGWHSTAGWSIT